MGSPASLEKVSLDGSSAEADTAFSETTQTLVRKLRALERACPLFVGGDAAAFRVERDPIASRLPLAITLLAVATPIILVLLSGSLLAPPLALLMEALTLAGAYGALILIFRDGRLESLLSYTRQGALDLTIPLVFARDLCRRPPRRLDRRLRHLEQHRAQNPWHRHALAALVDSLLVRCLLLPAWLRLLGERAWWLPDSPSRLDQSIGLPENPRPDADGEPQPGPAAPPANNHPTHELEGGILRPAGEDGNLHEQGGLFETDERRARCDVFYRR
jgi:hypothetical protein